MQASQPHPKHDAFAYLQEERLLAPRLMDLFDALDPWAVEETGCFLVTFFEETTIGWM